MSSDDDFSYESTTVPPGALFVAADEPLLIYPSKTAGERDLEAIDVVNGVYPAAYGPNGEPYEVGCDGDQVIIERTVGSNRPDELKELLLRYFEARGDSAEATASLENLVARAWSLERDFWLEHDPYGDRFATRIPAWGCIAVGLILAALVYFMFR